MPFASDNFAGAAGQDIAAYNALWELQSGYTQVAIIGIDGAYFNAPNTSAYGVYRHANAPASADYSVVADVKRIGGSALPQMGVCGRMQAAAGTYYAAIHFCNINQTRLYKFIATVPTQIGSSYAQTLTLGVASTIELRMTGSTIAAYVDGVQRISVTDASVTVAGNAGIIGLSMRDSGVADTGSIDNWSASDPVATSDLGGNVTLDEVAPTGTLADGGASGLSGGVTLDAVAPAGTLGMQPGVVTTAPFKNKFTGALMPSVTIPKVAVVRVSDMATVLTLADVVTNGSAVMQLTNAALVPGQAYLVITCNSDGSAYGAEACVAA